MFGISLTEAILITVLAILIIPPKEFPKLLRGGLKAYKKLQQAYTQLMREINLFDKD